MSTGGGTVSGITPGQVVGNVDVRSRRLYAAIRPTPQKLSTPARLRRAAPESHNPPRASCLISAALQSSLPAPSPTQSRAACCARIFENRTPAPRSPRLGRTAAGFCRALTCAARGRRMPKRHHAAWQRWPPSLRAACNRWPACVAAFRGRGFPGFRVRHGTAPAYSRSSGGEMESGTSV